MPDGPIAIVNAEATATLRCMQCHQPMPPAKKKGVVKDFCSDRCRANYRDARIANAIRQAEAAVTETQAVVADCQAALAQAEARLAGAKALLEDVLTKKPRRARKQVNDVRHIEQGRAPHEGGRQEGEGGSLHPPGQLADLGGDDGRGREDEPIGRGGSADRTVRPGPGEGIGGEQWRS